MMKRTLIVVAALFSIAVLIAAYQTITATGGNRLEEADKNHPDDQADLASTPEEWEKAVFPQDRLVDIDIIINEDSFRDLCKNARDKTFYPCTVVYDGLKLKNVAIRAKGNTSLNQIVQEEGERFSFKIDFDHYIDQTLYGLKCINLNNIFKDPTYMRDKLTYEMCEYLGLKTPKTAYCNVYINGELHGLYLVLQSVDDVFLNENFPQGDGDLYQPERQSGKGSDLNYIDDDIHSYSGLELKTNLETSTGDALINLLKTLDSGKNLESVLNIDDMLKYFAVLSAAVSLDSFAGGMYHNYYLYEENGVFTFIPWDFNFSFGSYSPVSFGQDGQLKNLSIDEFVNQRHITLLNVVFNNEEYLERYHGYLRELVEGPMTEANITKRVAELRQLIDDEVRNDPTAFFTYEEYDHAFYDNTGDSAIGQRKQSPGGKYAPKLFSFVADRAESIALQLEGALPEEDLLLPSESYIRQMQNAPRGSEEIDGDPRNNIRERNDREDEGIEGASRQEDMGAENPRQDFDKEKMMRAVFAILILIGISLILYLYPRFKNKA